MVLRSFSRTREPVSFDRSTLSPVIWVFRDAATLSTTSWATSLSSRVSWKLKSASSRSFSESLFSETTFVREEKASLSLSNNADY